MHFAWQFSVSFKCAESGLIRVGSNFSDTLLPIHTLGRYVAGTVTPFPSISNLRPLHFRCKPRPRPLTAPALPFDNFAPLLYYFHSPFSLSHCSLGSSDTEEHSMNYLRPTRLGVLLLAIFSLARPASAPIKLPKNSLLPQAAQKIPLAAATQALRANIFFERNDGQTDRQVLYLSHSLDYSLFLTRTGATIAVAEPEAAAPAAKSSSPPDP